MALKDRKKLLSQIAIGAAGVMTIIASFFSIFSGIFAAGVFAICGFILYDRMSRKTWENSIAMEISSISASQARMEDEIKSTQERIENLQTHITETTLNSRSNTRTEPSAAPVTRRRTSAVPAFAEKEREHQYNMPRALRPGHAEPQNYKDIVSAEQNLSETAVRTIVNDAVNNEHIEVFLQPIVRLPQRKVRYYEMFARVRAKPGMYLAAKIYMKVAQDFAQMRAIDKMLLTECLDLIRETAKLDRAAPFFINVTSASLKNSDYMKKLLVFLGRFPDLAPRLIFEMTQSDFKDVKGPAAEIIRSLGRLGCAFSIDHVTDFNFDVEKLLSLRVRYVKVAASDLLQRMKNGQMLSETQKLKRKLEGNGISLIVEKIEEESALRELLDFDINYGQGYLFGKPDLQSAYQDGTRMRQA